MNYCIPFVFDLTGSYHIHLNDRDVDEAANILYSLLTRKKKKISLKKQIISACR